MVRAEIIERQKALQKTPMLERIASIREQLVAAGDEAQRLRHPSGFEIKPNTKSPMPK